MMPKKKVLFVITSLGYGGAEKQTVSLINLLDRSIFEAALCYFVADDSLRPELEEEKLAGVCCTGKTGRFNLPKTARRLSRFIDQLKPHIVVSVNPYVGLCANFARFFVPRGFGTFK